MWYVWNCSWAAIQLFKKFFSLLRCRRIDSFLFFTAGCSYSCFVHGHIITPWSGIRGSNSRPIPWQGIALPTELIPHKFWCPRRDSNSHATKHWLLRPACLPFHHQGKKLVPDVGIELTTYRLQGGCSTTELIRRDSIYENYLAVSTRIELVPTA